LVVCIFIFVSKGKRKKEEEETIIFYQWEGIARRQDKSQGRVSSRASSARLIDRRRPCVPYKTRPFASVDAQNKFLFLLFFLLFFSFFFTPEEIAKNTQTSDERMRRESGGGIGAGWKSQNCCESRCLSAISNSALASKVSLYYTYAFSLYVCLYSNCC
jgi:hypothetical protein